MILLENFMLKLKNIISNDNKINEEKQKINESFIGDIIEKIFLFLSKGQIEDAKRKIEKFKNSPEMKAKIDQIAKEREELVQLAAQDDNLANFFNKELDNYIKNK